MNRDVIKRKWLLAGFSAFLIYSGISCTGADAADVETLRRKQFVNEDVFLSITNGTSLADVKTKLGPAVRHQFTAVESGHTWTLIRCFLHTGREESYTFYQLLFRDDALVKTIGWIQMDREEYAYAGTTATRSKPWDIEDTKYVRTALKAPAVTHEQIRANLKDARETMAKYKGQGNLPAVVGLLFAPALNRRYNKEFPINEDLRQRYDGCRASIGMTLKEVDALYGEPLRGFTTRTGCVARIYGNHRYSGDMDHFLLFSYVAVLFDSEGHVTNIYSDGFFCSDWDPDMPLGRRD